jgi:cell division protein FtsB
MMFFNQLKRNKMSKSSQDNQELIDYQLSLEADNDATIAQLKKTNEQLVANIDNLNQNIATLQANIDSNNVEISSLEAGNVMIDKTITILAVNNEKTKK